MKQQHHFTTENAAFYGSKGGRTSGHQQRRQLAAILAADPGNAERVTNLLAQGYSLKLIIRIVGGTSK